MKAPPRLLDDPALAAELRTDLERAATTTPAYDVRAGLGSLQAAIIAGAAAAASAPSSAAAAHASSAGTTVAAKAASAGVWSTLAAKVTIASLVTAAAVTTTVIAWPAKRPERTVAPREAVSVPAAPRSPIPHAPDPAPTPTTHNPSEASDPAPVLAHVPVPVLASVHEPVASSADLRREIDQLGRIKSLVETDPGQAYRLAQRGDREFSRGMLRQEREALAIVALSNSDRRSEAARRLRVFAARYPHSPARERLEQLLGTARE